jgi:uncharacterized SAM-binding protein YcdF (DUF218 family)
LIREARTKSKLLPVKSRARIVWLALAGLLALAVWFHTALLVAFASYLVRSGPPGKADMILVLGGDAYGNRILTAAELVRRGYAPKILVSGPPGFYGYHECDLAIPFAEKAGYPASYFLHFEHDATSTQEEAMVDTAELRRLEAKRVLLVTSDFHTRRAGKIFRATAPDLTFYVVAAPDAHFTVQGWWHDREGRKTFVLEWEKTVAGWVGM